MTLTARNRETFEASKIFSIITEIDLGEIRDHFGVPNTVELVFPGLPPNCIAIHKHLMDMGLKLPFHPFYLSFGKSRKYNTPPKGNYYFTLLKHAQNSSPHPIKCIIGRKAFSLGASSQWPFPYFGYASVLIVNVVSVLLLLVLLLGLFDYIHSDKLLALLRGRALKELCTLVAPILNLNFEAPEADGLLS